MNATLRMWKNRFARMYSAWNDNESEESTPLVIPMKYMLLTYSILFVLWYFYLNSYLSNISVNENNSFLILWIVVLTSPMILCRIGCSLSKAKENYEDTDYAENQEQANDNLAFCWGVVCVLWTCVFVLVNLIILRENYHDRPVDKVSWQYYKQMNPDCTRYDDWKNFRLKRSEPLVVKDMSTATIECQQRSKILDQQKVLN